MSERRPDRREARFAGASLLLLMPLLLSSGCGNVTAGGLGETVVLISGDGEAGANASVLPASAVPGISFHRGRESPVSFESVEPGVSPQALLFPPAVSHGRVQGRATVRLRVWVHSETGIWMELTRGEQELEVDLSGETEEEIVTVELQRGIYRRARVVFTHVSAEVEQEGGEASQRLDVDLTATGGEVAVERDVFLLVDDRSRQELLVDLRSPMWITLANLPVQPVHTVAANVFRNAVRITVR